MMFIKFFEKGMNRMGGITGSNTHQQRPEGSDTFRKAYFRLSIPTQTIHSKLKSIRLLLGNLKNRTDNVRILPLKETTKTHLLF